MSTKLVAAFLERVQRSGLVSELKLSQLRQELETEGVDLENPNATAAALVDRGVLTSWQVEKILQGKHKGFFLGSYRLLRPLGKGGMGAVFLAQHEMMRRQCAIKVLPQTQIDKHSSVLERFYVEAQAVASLDHPNIVRAYDVSKEVKDNKEIHYLVMEFVEGQDAQVMVQESGVLDYVKAAEIIRQTANGLAHAHENGLIHRDIKPANLLIDKKGVVRILDLGLARFHDDSGAASLTAAHNETVLGTADYLSPEQALNSHNVDPRTDIYSLGCTAYFLLTGHPPFPDGSVAQRLVAHQVKQPKPISDERPGAPPELMAIISKMMAKEPANRFPNAAETSTALAAWLLQYGGEDWRRQHSEIAGDSSILSLLSQHREPTRAMSSPGSETELEFAPLDDGPPAPGDQPAAAVAKKKGRASSVAGKSGAIKKKPSDDVDLTLAEDEETHASAAEATPAPPEKSAKKSDTKVKAEPKTEAKAATVATPSLLEELPPMTSTADADPLAAPDLLAGLPAEDALASLDQVDLMGPGESGSSLGAIESHVKLAPSRGPSSSTRLKAKSEPAAKPKTPVQSILSVGFPILIGVGGGLLLVLIIILLILFSKPSTESASARAGAGTVGMPQPPQEQPPVAAAVPTPEVQTPAVPTPAVQTPAVEPPKPVEPPAPASQPNPAELKPAQASDQPPAAQEGVSTHGSQGKRKKDRDQPKTPLEPAEAPSRPAKTEPSAAASAKPETSVQPPESPPAPEVAKPAEEPKPTEQPPEVPQADPDKLFAELTEFALELKPGGDPKSVPKEMALGLNFLAQSIRKKLQESAKTIDLEVVDQSSKATMEVTMTPSLEPPYLALSLSAQLKCPTSDGGSVVVWTGDTKEVFRFTQFDAKSTPRLWEEKVLDFFKPLGKAHREAKGKPGKKE